jgi:hypothetical protein
MQLDSEQLPSEEVISDDTTVAPIDTLNNRLRTYFAGWNESFPTQNYIEAALRYFQKRYANCTDTDRLIEASLDEAWARAERDVCPPVAKRSKQKSA